MAPNNAYLCLSHVCPMLLQQRLPDLCETSALQAGRYKRTSPALKTNLFSKPAFTSIHIFVFPQSSCMQQHTIAESGSCEALLFRSDRACVNSSIVLEERSRLWVSGLEGVSGVSCPCFGSIIVARSWSRVSSSTYEPWTACNPHEPAIGHTDPIRNQFV